MRSLAATNPAIISFILWRETSVILPVLLAIVICLILQNNLLNTDAAYLLYASNEMLNGGNYVHNFFETNPPLILYLYAPACLLAKMLNVPYASLFKYYILGLSLLSVAGSYFLLTRITQDKFIRTSCLLILLFSILLFPYFDYGQREHLAVIFITPYLFSTALFADKKASPATMAIFIGLFAGLGFAIKPFFLIPLCMCEAYLIVRKKHILGWVRRESLLILTVMLAYLVILLHRHSDYLHTVLPLVNKYYYTGAKQSYVTLINSDCFLYCLSCLLAGMLLKPKNKLRDLINILLLAQSGFIAAYFCGGTNWFYHIYPALTYSLILITTLLAYTLSSWFSAAKKSLVPSTSLGAVIALFLVFLSLLMGRPDNIKLQMGTSNAINTGLLFLLLGITTIGSMKTYTHKIFLPLTLAAMAGIFFGINSNIFFINAEFASGLIFYLNYFIVSVIIINLVIMVLALFKINLRWFFSVPNMLLLSASLYAVYGFPLTNLIDRYIYVQPKVKAENSLLDLINQKSASGGVYCIGMDDCYPCFSTLVTKAGHENANRYPSFWWMRIATMNNTQPEIMQDQHSFNDTIVSDLQGKQPQWVIIYPQSFKELIPNFDVIQYLSTNQQFFQEWQHYALKKQFFTKDFIVYERVN